MQHKTRSLVQGCLGAAALASAPALSVAGDGAYVGIEGGLNWELPQDLRTPDHAVLDRLHFDQGWDAGLIGGYSFANGWRPELELDYRRNNLNHDFLGGAAGSDSAATKIANLWYDFKAPTGVFSWAHPYLGGGVGAVRSYYRDARSYYRNLPNQPVALNSDYATEWAYQAGAGVDFDLTPRLTLGLDYRRLWSNRGNFDNGYALPIAVHIDSRYLAQTALLSVRYSFGAAPAAVVAEAPPPPAPAPVATPAPSPPPVVATPAPCNPPAGFQVDANCHIIDQTIVVRAVDFEFNSVSLTAPARETLNRVAAALVAQPALQIEIQGYTDSIGSASTNLKLSQRRAEAVKDYLIQQGANGTSLTARGYGKSMPIADNGTAEGRAQNRRVAFEVINTPAHVDVQTQGASAASTQAAEQGEPVGLKK